MQKIVGIPGAKGEAVGTAMVLEDTNEEVEMKSITDVQTEKERFLKVQEEYAKELDETYKISKKEIGEEAAEIFQAYKRMVTDTVFFKKPMKKVEKELICMEYAIEQEKNKVIAKFEKMEDQYMRERAADVKNVCNELIRRLQGRQNLSALSKSIEEPFIIVAQDLSPEDTVKVDKQYLKGFVTEQGGVTSHAVILAKTLGIPAIVGTSGILDAVEQGQTIYMNGKTGQVFVDPDQDLLAAAQKSVEAMREMKAQYEACEQLNAVTRDNKKVKVCINSGDKDSIAGFRRDCCDGIGLFRTEFLYMNETDYPSEEKQYGIYKKVAEMADGKEVIIRTLDIGGDKQLDYMNLPVEKNPFLGYRAIRLCLDRKEVFKTQLRAILRASACGNIKIMFPMIVTIEEFLEAKGLVEEAKKELSAEGIAYNPEVQTGVMIETPASVQISDKLARHADFFSIGTNDLIQYTTATDRMNEKIQYLYDSCNLSVLKSIHTVIQNGHKEQIQVGMCGEVASDEKMVPLLLAMGLDEFSVVPGQVGALKYLIRGLEYDKIRELPEQILALDTIQEVKEMLHRITK